MSSCSECNKPLPRDGNFVECKNCDREMHFQCSTISEKTYRSMAQTARNNWRCGNCKGIKQSLDTSEMAKHFADLKRDIEKSQQFLSDRYEELMIKVNENGEIMSQMSKTIESLVGKVKERDDVIMNLTSRLNQLEQYGRNCNLELGEVMEVERENLEDVVVAVARKMDINLTPAEIETVHRLPAKKDRIRSIIVQLNSRKKRDEFILKRNKVRITNDDLLRNGNKSKVYVNENLTPFYKNLLWKAKNVQKEKGYEFAWFRFGKVLMRKDERSPVIKINQESDLNKLV